MKILSTKSPNFGANFTKLEKQMINEVRDYTIKNGVETCKIIKKGNDITSKFDLIETNGAVAPKIRTDVFESSKFGFKEILSLLRDILAYKKDMRGSIYIHSHPSELPLSFTDIVIASKNHVKKMIAVTPSGKTSIIEDANKNKKKIIRCANSFASSEKLFFELKEKYGDVASNPEAFEKYKRAYLKDMDAFQKATGIKYESEI